MKPKGACHCRLTVRRNFHAPDDFGHLLCDVYICKILWININFRTWGKGLKNNLCKWCFSHEEKIKLATLHKCSSVFHNIVHFKSLMESPQFVTQCHRHDRKLTYLPSLPRHYVIIPTGNSPHNFTTTAARVQVSHDRSLVGLSLSRCEPALDSQS